MKKNLPKSVSWQNLNLNCEIKFFWKKYINYYFLNSFADTDDEDEYLKKQRANNAAAARNRRSRQKSSVSTPAPTQQVAAFPQPPKERPDAKHHLKVLF